ncbi:MAG: DUF4177 domain-containing protein [Pirellulaceae bacterium]
MRSRMVAALSLGILMGMVAWSSLRQPEAQAQVGPEKQQWEYKVVAFEVDNPNGRNVKMHEETINSLAAEGWEYVGLLCAGPHPYHTGQSGPVNSGGNVLFRRPKSLSTPKE